MKRILAGALGGVAVAMAIFGAGPANADNEYAGQTYGKAAASISGYGGTAVIASRVGDYLPTEECIVTRSRSAKFLDSSGNAGSKVHLYLNCNDTQTAGHPGYSAATPTGKKALEAKQQSLSLSDDYAKAVAAGSTPACLKNDDNANYCTKLCTASKACSAELSEALGL